MAHPITPVDAFTLPVTVPDNSDPGSNRAGDVEAIAQALANQTNYLNLHTVKLDTSNTLTGGQTLSVADATIPPIAVSSSAHQHPGSASNRWKLISQWALSDGTFVRWYAGEGNFGDKSTWCITTNAVWNPTPSSSTGQKWSKDVSGLESNSLFSQIGELYWYGRQSGGGVWQDTEWDDQGRGSLHIGNAINAKSLTTSEGLTVGSNLDVNGNADVLGGDLRVTNGNMLVSAGYNYTAAKTRTVCIGFAGANVAFLGSDGAFAQLSPAEIINLPISVPHGASLQNVKIKMSTTGNVTYYAKLTRKWGINMTDTSVPTNTWVANTGNVAITSGTYNVTLNWGGLAANSLEAYWLTVLNDNGSAATLTLHAVQCTYTETAVTTAVSQ